MNKKKDTSIFIGLMLIFCILALFHLIGAVIPVLILIAAIICVIYVILEVLSRDSSNPKRQREARRAKEKFGRFIGRTSSTIGRQSAEAARKAKQYYDENMAEPSPKTGTWQNGSSSGYSGSAYTEKDLLKKSGVQSSEPPMHPFYVKALSDLKKDVEIVSSRKAKVYDLLDDLFGDSTITIDRYRQVIDFSEKTLKKNLEEAEKAVSVLDARQVPTPDHKAIIENFVKNSQEIVDSFEKVVLELLELQQNRTLDASDHLDENLDELARTTRYYRSQGGR